MRFRNKHDSGVNLHEVNEQFISLEERLAEAQAAAKEAAETLVKALDHIMNMSPVVQAAQRAVHSAQSTVSQEIVNADAQALIAAVKKYEAS